ncbi:VPLPA-CTERM sorting domain-containing protein [Primorskyibacter sp. 2E107]|uniref:VPLPA-CTERM sorting domain-containing protein n=1 Tax=Primorskyibacter sp. 2E107 TaxID=3403458 RepID=UPI003AF5BE0B
MLCEFGCNVYNTVLSAFYFADAATGTRFTIADVRVGGEIGFRDVGGTFPVPQWGRFGIAENYIEDTSVGIYNGDGSLGFARYSPSSQSSFYDDVTWTSGYALSAVPSVSDVPLPASGLMLLGAIGLANAMRRRRKG